MTPKDTIKKITGTKHLGSTYKNREKIILRDFLAMERTTLANERTLFAYLRAGVYMIIAGFAFLELKEFVDLIWLSYVLFSFSIILFVFGITRYAILKRKLDVFYDAMEDEYHVSETDKAQES